jgi:hypothetical protein
VEALLEKAESLSERWAKSSSRALANAKDGAEGSGEEEQVELPITQGRGRKRKRKLRSRNPVVDRWLQDEDGSDAYADLEGFLAEDEYTTW